MPNHEATRKWYNQTPRSPIKCRKYQTSITWCGILTSSLGNSLCGGRKVCCASYRRHLNTQHAPTRPDKNRSSLQSRFWPHLKVFFFYDVGQRPCAGASEVRISVNTLCRGRALDGGQPYTHARHQLLPHLRMSLAYPSHPWASDLSDELCKPLAASHRCMRFALTNGWCGKVITAIVLSNWY